MKGADAAVQRLLDAVPVCQKDPLFLATLGQLLNREGRYLEAADHLERALMLEPGLKDAQLSYAVAMAALGDVASATGLLDNLLADPELPAHLRTLIARQKSALTGMAAPAGWQRRITLASRLGYDSNLLGSPNLSSMSLTLAGQTLVLPLDTSYLAHGGAYVRADAQLDLQRVANDGARWDGSAALRSRASQAVEKSGSTQLDLLLERSHLDASPVWGGSYANVTASSLRSQAGTRYQAVGAAVGWGRPWATVGNAACQLRGGLEWQSRNYFDNALLSGRYSGLSAAGSCEQASGAQWLVALKGGTDAASDNARAGGNQQQTSLRLAAIWPLAALTPPGMPALGMLRNSRLLADYEHSQQEDSSGYSALLESGRTRVIWRRVVRLEYQHPFAKTAQWVLGAEKTAQDSSLPLFQQQSWGAYAGLRAVW